MIRPWLRGAEPKNTVAPGQHVLLDAECRYVKAVDHVHGGHDQLHVLAERYVQRVDFALAFGMFELPHPLLGDYVDFGCPLGWGAFVEVDERSAQKEGEEKEHGQH